MFLGFQWMQNNKSLVPGSMGISFVIIKYYKPIDNISIFFAWKQQEIKEGNGFEAIKTHQDFGLIQIS